MTSPDQYHLYSYKPLNNGENVASKTFRKLSLYSFVAGIILLAIFYAPSLFYNLQGGGVASISKLLVQTLQNKKPAAVTHIQSGDYEPKFDPKLPLASRLKINAIGVDTTLQEATLENHEDALEKGVWRVSDFGSPADRSKPTILVAHRYGYLAWTNFFRKSNSFFSLPDLEVGDTVEISWKQRKYTYEIYAEEKGEEITDYKADLILYTCESLNSKVRIFKYARLLEI